MKKRFLGSILISMMVLSACSLTGTGDKTPVQNEAKTEENTAAGENKADSQDKTDDVSSDAATQEATDDLSNSGDYLASRVFLKEPYDSTFVGVADMNGNVLGNYTLREIKSIFEKSNTIYTPDDFLLEKDGILYYSCDEKNYKGKALFAVDPSSEQIAHIADFDSSSYISVFDYFDGAFRMEYLEGEYGSDRHFKVIKITKDDDALSYSVEEDNSLKNFYDQLSTYDIYVRRIEYNSECYERVLAEDGFVIRKKDEDYFTITADGTAEQISNLPEKTNGVWGYDSDYMILYTIDENYYTNGIYVYSFKDKESTRLSFDPQTFEAVSYQNGKIYYSLKTEEEFGINNVELHSYDVSSGADKKLASKKKVPGTRSLEPFDSLIIKNGKMFYIDFEGETVNWYMADLEDYDNTIYRINMVRGKIDTFNFGNVEYISTTYKCPFCGTPVNKLYAEVFVLDSKYSEYADKINAALREEFEGMAATVNKGDENATDEECEYHKTYPDRNCVTDTYTVGQVKIIDDRYLTVHIDGYWYGGGAHGMPSMEQRLFDLKTGDELSIKDFYKGSEADFKELIAGKVKEDYESYGEGEIKPYFAVDADTVYKESYEMVNMTNVLYGTEGITYYFYPYDLASFADGFMEYIVTYEELLGRKTLSE